MSKEVGEMVRSSDVVQAEGSARTEGARRATGVRADGAAAGAGSLAPGQRWSASRKRDVVRTRSWLTGTPCARSPRTIRGRP